MEHPESEIPFVVSDYQVLDGNSRLLFESKGNYKAINDIRFEVPIETDRLKFVFSKNKNHIPVSITQISVY